MLKRGDFIILAICLVIICWPLAATAGTFSKGSAVVHVVTPYGEYLYQMNQDRVVEIQGLIGITVMQIEDSKVRFLESPCSGKDCLHGEIASNGEQIACLPNGVLATLSGADDGGVDGISY